ncbi:hypothetical protein, partial [Vibrio sp. Y2-5]|uniref:hypothetical protein n=1 Tax=Vibrio sp. Y2-5 TaxID=2743977 RepID=UPI001CB74D98
MCLSVLPSFASANTFDDAIPSTRNGYVWSFSSSVIASGDTKYYRVDENFPLTVSEFRMNIRKNTGVLDTSVISFYSGDKKLIKSILLSGFIFDDLTLYRLDEIKSVKYFSIKNNTGSNFVVSRLEFSNGDNAKIKFPFV